MSKLSIAKFNDEKIGAYATRILREHAVPNKLTSQDVLDMVREQFPSAKTELASIAWYKSKLVNDKSQTIVREVVKEDTIESVEAEILQYEEKILELKLKVASLKEKEKEEKAARIARMKEELAALEAAE